MAVTYPFKRACYEEVEKSISKLWVTFVLGPRKCGKTVCLLQIRDTHENTEYVDFKTKTTEESNGIFRRIQNSIDNNEDKIYLLDEMSYASEPDLNIYRIAGQYTKYYMRSKQNTHVVFTGSPIRALDLWSAWVLADLVPGTYIWTFYPTGNG